VFNLYQNARNITPREFRLSVIEVLVKYYGTLATPDYSNVCFGLQYLNRPKQATATRSRAPSRTLFWPTRSPSTCRRDGEPGLRAADCRGLPRRRVSAYC
jgi:hypothetical protein